MRLSIWVLGLISLLGLPACFNPNETCHVTCESDNDCQLIGSGFHCLGLAGGPHLCALAGQTCGSTDGGSSAFDADAADRPIGRPYALNGSGGGIVVASGGASGVATGGTGGESTGGMGGIATGGAGGEATGGTTVEPDGGMGDVAVVGTGGVNSTGGAAGGLAGAGGSGATGGGGGAAGPPGPCPERTTPLSMFCQGTFCRPIPEAVRSGLALWLDPSNLGPVGTRVSTWCDQSGKMNQGQFRNSGALPLVTATGLELVYNAKDAALAIPHSPSIDLAGDDFLILVVAGITHGSEGKSFFQKTDGDFDLPKQIALEWVVPDGMQDFRVTGRINNTAAISTVPTDAGPTRRLYGLRRVHDFIEVRVNGQIVSTPMALGTPGASVANTSDAFLGEFGSGDTKSIDTLHAAVIVRGQLDSSEVGQLEADLIAAFAL